MHIIEILNLIVSSITAFALIFAVIQITINRKQLFQSTISKCIDNFRELGALTRKTSDSQQIFKYIDLTNEELFYFQNNYIPKVIMKEWIDGMIDYIPIKDKNGNILNKKYCIKKLAEKQHELFRNFPRIQNAFEVKNNYDWDLIYTSRNEDRNNRLKERIALIKEIIQNINNFELFS